MNIGSAIAPSASPALAESHRRNRTPWRDALLGMLVGLAAFFALGFHHVLPPHRIGWLLVPSQRDWFYDPATAYLSWDFYRRAPWAWPPGMNMNYGMEVGGSITFTDPVGLMAMILKPFSPWLGHHFQYFGIWILICFLLQGMFGALLAGRFVRGAWAKAAIAGFFALSPIMLERAWTEHALMGHWLILWAIYLYFLPRRSRFRWVWLIVAMLSVITTSFYLAPMIGVLWAADAARDAMGKWRRLPRLALEGGAVVATMLLTMWLSGYGSLSMHDAITSDFGKFATNILGPIDPWKWSAFLREQPKAPDRLGEGFAYFGFGMLLLASISVFEWMRKPLNRGWWKSLVPLIIVLLGCALFAVTNNVAIGSKVYRFPNIWGEFGEIFRASGRMFWPTYYGAWAAIFYLAIRNLTPRKAGLLLSVMLLVQIADLSPSHIPMRDFNATDPAWHSPLTDPFWTAAAGKYRKLVVIPTNAKFPYVPLSEWASQQGMETNCAYMGRNPSVDFMADVSAEREKNLRADHPDPQTLYVIPDDRTFSAIAKCLDRNSRADRINGYNIVAPNWTANGRE